MTEFERQKEENMKAYKEAGKNYDELDKEVKERVEDIILDEDTLIWENMKYMRGNAEFISEEEFLKS